MKIYIVMGGTGEYSDRREWTVWAREQKEQAEADVRRLDAAAREFVQKYPYGSRSAQRKADLEQLEDKSFDLDYTGTSYFLYETELRKGTDDGEAIA